MLSSSKRDSNSNQDEKTPEHQKPSALDLIQMNFNAVQNKYMEDFEKETLIGYDEALTYLDQFLQFRQDQQQENNYPFIITGDEGCGKTHTIIQWLQQVKSVYEESGGQDNQIKNQNKLTLDGKEAVPNVTPKGDVLFTFFAGIETINSRLELTQLKPPEEREGRPGFTVGTSHNKPPRKAEKGETKDKHKFTNAHNKYQSFIYSTMTKIRQTYKIDRRVEILDDQLRTNFRKWLEIANKEHKENMPKNSQIILVLDGPEKFTDEFGYEQSADWIPNSFPDRFKVIICVQKKSKAMQHFIQRKYPMLLLRGLHREANFQDFCLKQDLDPKENSVFIKKVNELVHFDQEDNIKLFSRKQQLEYEDQMSALINVKLPLNKNPTFLVCLILFRTIFESIKNPASLVDLFEKILINLYEHKSPIQAQIFLQILIYLSSTRKGVILSELKELLVSKDSFSETLAELEIEEFVEVFDFAYTYNEESNLLMSQNYTFVKSINCLIKYVNQKKIPNIRELFQTQQMNEKVTYNRNQLVLNICGLIEKQPFSLRQIDELAFQYQSGKFWPRMKDLLSSIEVFSILYNPETKHQLAQYWQILEQFRYDPVAEYNRSLEGFVFRYRPNNEEIFVILIQLSRFLRELADFETKTTPQFQHPKLIGNKELDQITLLQEIQRLGSAIYEDTDIKTTNSSYKSISQGTQNMDNPVHRDAFKVNLMLEIEQEIELEESSEQNQMTNPRINKTLSNYYYKRWLWVQFPWWCINVFQNISEIMSHAISLSSFKDEVIKNMHPDEKAQIEKYFSIDQENELVIKTLEILKDAKLRKQGEMQVLKGDNLKLGRKATLKSITVQKAIAQAKKKDVDLKKPKIHIFSGNHLIMMKEKIKNFQTSQKKPPIGRSFSLSKRIKSKPETPGQPQVKQSVSLFKKLDDGLHRYGSAPKLSMRFLLKDNKNQQGLFDQNQTSNIVTNMKKKMLIKNDENIQKLSELYLKLKIQLNQRQYDVQRLTENLDEIDNNLAISKIQMEDRENDQNINECEKIEAAILLIHEKLNFLEVERKRMDQIIQVLVRNPADNPESNKLNIQKKDSILKLIEFETNVTKVSKLQTEQATKEINTISQNLEKKINERANAHLELETYLKRLGRNVITNQQQNDIMIQKIKKIRTQQDQEIQSSMSENFRSHRGLRSKRNNGISARRFNFKTGPVPDQSQVIEHLKSRLKSYRTWIMKLRVSLCFLNEKKSKFISQFNQISESTNIFNPNDIESLNNMLERTKELMVLKEKKDMHAQQLRNTKKVISDQLKQLEKSAPGVKGKESDREHKNVTTAILQKEIMTHKTKFDISQDQMVQKLAQIAKVKSAFINLSKKLNIDKEITVDYFEGKKTEQNQKLAQMSGKILEKFEMIKSNIDLQTSKTSFLSQESPLNVSEQKRVQFHNPKTRLAPVPTRKEDSFSQDYALSKTIALKKYNEKRALSQSELESCMLGLTTGISEKQVNIKKFMREEAEENYRSALKQKLMQNQHERHIKEEEEEKEQMEQMKQQRAQITKDDSMTPMVKQTVSSNSEMSFRNSISLNQEQLQKLQKTHLPKYKLGGDIAPIVQFIRKTAKKELSYKGKNQILYSMLKSSNEKDITTLTKSQSTGVLLHKKKSKASHPTFKIKKIKIVPKMVSDTGGSLSRQSQSNGKKKELKLMQSDSEDSEQEEMKRLEKERLDIKKAFKASQEIHCHHH